MQNYEERSHYVNLLRNRLSLILLPCFIELLVRIENNLNTSVEVSKYLPLGAMSTDPEFKTLVLESLFQIVHKNKKPIQKETLRHIVAKLSILNTLSKDKKTNYIMEKLCDIDKTIFNISTKSSLSKLVNAIETYTIKLLSGFKYCYFTASSLPSYLNTIIRSSIDEMYDTETPYPELNKTNYLNVSSYINNYDKSKKSKTESSSEDDLIEYVSESDSKNSRSNHVSDVSRSNHVSDVSRSNHVSDVSRSNHVSDVSRSKSLSKKSVSRSLSKTSVSKSRSKDSGTETKNSGTETKSVTKAPKYMYQPKTSKTKNSDMLISFNSLKK